MTPDDWDVYDKVCKDRFAKIEKQLDDIEKQVTNDIPHKIDGMFWKYLGITITFVGIVIGVLRLMS